MCGDRKACQSSGGADAYELGRKPPQLAAGKPNGWRFPEKPCFLLGPVLTTGLCLGCWEAHADLLLEKGSVGHVSEKGDRNGRAKWGRMLTSVNEITWEPISASEL